MKKVKIFLLALIAILFGAYIADIILERNIMRIDAQEAAKLRDKLHNLDIGNVCDNEIYYQTLYYITASGEGFKPKVYTDTNGKLTIGFGFNMDRGAASENEWNNIFKGEVSFDKAKRGEIEISREQALMLKKHGITKREIELAKIYAPYWNQMRLNERAILTDLYYQSPELAGKKTRIAKYMKEYYKTNKVTYLDLAVTEIRDHSSYAKNPLTRIGLQNRNNIREIIFDSRNSLLFSVPHDELIPKGKELEVTLGKTIISREISEKYPVSNNLGDYYIWRTRMDDKVRSGHQELEGKVFKHEDDAQYPGKDFGCRCYRENLPIHAVIIENEEKSFYDELERKALVYPYRVFNTGEHKKSSNLQIK